MNVEYKKLTRNELDVFNEMRINQLREEGSTEDIDLENSCTLLINPINIRFFVGVHVL